nr:unnamed protein product [Spirometra erinaceieuropaei]
MKRVVSSDEIPAQCLGETGALSYKPPTEQDLKDSASLEEALAQMNIFETSEEIMQRREALLRLQDISNKWIYKKALEQNLPDHIASATTGKIFTFGSYRLGVNFRGADIDALFVVPRFITRDEFFSEFQAVLTEEEAVEEIHAVVDAFVPVLKLKFMGVEIDLLFAQVDMMSVPENFSLSENTEQLLRNMDERDVRSVNGVRVTEDILNLVFDKDVFKTALKVIRLWAKRKQIYSNALGFLGGVSWGILTCRICQLYPCAAPSTIVYLFFTIFSQWPWPKPVRLRDSEYIPGLNLAVWDPRHNPPDQYHLMPILTPSYPSQNSTYNVQRSNRIIIQREIMNGLNLMKEILLRQRPWSDLFEPTFFFTYRHYVVVIVTGEEKRSFVELCGLVESRLRVLVGNFETNRYVKIAHVNCRSYGRGPQDSTDLVKKWFIGMEFDRNANSMTSLTTVHAPSNGGEKPKLNIDLSDNISSFEKSIERGISCDESTNTVTVKYAKKSQLSQFISAEEMEEIKKMAAATTAAGNHAVQSGSTNLARKSSSSVISDSLSTCDSPASIASPLLTRDSPQQVQQPGTDAEDSQPPSSNDRKDGRSEEDKAKGADTAPVSPSKSPTPSDTRPGVRKHSPTPVAARGDGTVDGQSGETVSADDDVALSPTSAAPKRRCPGEALPAENGSLSVIAEIPLRLRSRWSTVQCCHCLQGECPSPLRVALCLLRLLNRAQSGA